MIRVLVLKFVILVELRFWLGIAHFEAQIFHYNISKIFTIILDKTCYDTI